MLDLPRFYHREALEGKSLILSEDEGRHAKVLRLASGDQVHVINGAGGLYDATLNISKRTVELNINKVIANERKSNRELTLAVAPTKNIGRFEWIVEKATEVGVSRIIPIRCAQSERIHLKVDRLNKIAVSAMKQSKGLWIPEVTELQGFESILSLESKSKWIAHCGEVQKHGIKSLADTVGSQLIAIGPEGDFNRDEIQQAKSHGFEEVSLGRHRLRTETAAIVACVSANLFHD